MVVTRKINYSLDEIGLTDTYPSGVLKRHVV